MNESIETITVMIKYNEAKLQIMNTGSKYMAFYFFDNGTQS